MPQPSRRRRAAAPILAIAVFGATSLLSTSGALSEGAPNAAAAADRRSADKVVALRKNVVAAFRRVQTRSARLGLDRPERLNLGRRADALRRQLDHWRIVGDFLGERRELSMTERHAGRGEVAAARAPRLATHRLRRQVAGLYRRVVERSEDLGVTAPAPMRLATAEPALLRQRDHWQSVGEFLAARREVRRGEELTPRWGAWMCIHEHEGSWEAATGNGYYGGLQMDMNFMRAYGGELLAKKGTANNWTPTEQVMVADRAWRTRGFYPWPNTARMCGLI
jgi:hypothetical protein